MKKLILIAFMFCFATSVFAGDCNMQSPGRYTQYTVKSWTGSCANGVISGDGKGVFVNNIIRNANLGDGEEIIVGKFTGGLDSQSNGTIGSGYVVTKSINQYAHVLYFSSKPAIGGISSDNDENGKPIAYTCFQSSNILSRNSMCSQQLSKGGDISFDEVVNKLYQYASQRNIKGMDKETFLSLVIEADYKKDIARREIMKDDPPVAGITLSLGGDDAKPAKKSKKKN